MKPKFRPEITRVKLNPEQTVLQCDCYNVGHVFTSDTYWLPAVAGGYGPSCAIGAKTWPGEAPGCFSDPTGMQNPTEFHIKESSSPSS